MKKLIATVSSQYKLLPNADENTVFSRSVNKATMLKNDTFSFQVLFRAPECERWNPLSIKVKCEGVDIEVYKVGYVAVRNIANEQNEKGYVSNTPGLFPNPLYPRTASPEISRISKDFFAEKGEDNILSSDGSFSSLWVSVNPDRKNIVAGEKTIEIELLSLKSGESLEKESFVLEVIDKELCDSGLYYTNWFHVDCLCDHYGIEPYGESFYCYFESFAKNMVRHRQNTLLIPAFTPALDTPVGYERRNVQLVDVTKTESGYTFGFDRLKKHLEICDKCGIKHFEHPHLFSQWGAEKAVNIYSSDGTHLFGWQTDASSPEYVKFLTSYLNALYAFEKENGYEGRFIFHISDEPTKENMPTYSVAVDVVRELLSERKVIDALIDVDVYKAGMVKTPVAFMNEAHVFAKECDDFWLYYTGGPSNMEITNRLITNTAERTRVLGLQLWYYGAHGFLHWGYNYCYDYLSRGFYDPLADACGYKNFPGASYLAYYTPKGAIPSICEKLMAEAFGDADALYTLEALVGKDEVINLCERVLGNKISNSLIPNDDELFALRLAVNEAIRNAK